MEGLKERLIWLPLEKLRKAAWNYKLDEPEKINKLLEQIIKNGILETSVVRELPKGLYEIVDGNHRFEVYQKLQVKSIPCFTLGKIGLKSAKRIAVEINETRFSSDPLKLSELLKDISSEYNEVELAQTMPYTEDEIKDMIHLIDFDWNQFGVTGNEGTEQTLYKISFSVNERLFKQWQKLVGEDEEEKVFNDAVKALSASRK